jgi:V/A-type H+-transporting ATPase subunit I
MITLRALIHNDDSQELLISLQKAGIVHLDNHSHNPVHEQINTENELKNANQAAIILKNLDLDENTSITSPQTSRNISETIQDVIKLDSELQEQKLKLLQIEKEIELLQPWGNFDPEILKALQKKNLQIRFYLSSAKNFFDLNYPSEQLIFPQKTNYPSSKNEIQSGNVQFAVMVPKKSEELKNCTPLNIPLKSLNKIETSYSELQKSIKETESKLKYYQKNQETIQSHITELENQNDFYSASFSRPRHLDGKLIEVSGHFPEEHQKKITAILEQFDCWYSLSEPGKYEDVPVELKNNAFNKLFEPILGLLSLPNYRELDPTPFFAPFFALFFSLCLGDLGYGALLTIAGVVAIVKAPASFKNISKLVSILGALTMASGLLLNSFFGENFLGGPGIENSIFSSGAQKFAPFAPVAGDKGVIYPMMNLALVIAVFQVFIGMLLQAYNRFKYMGKAYSLVPISYILMLWGMLSMGAHTNFLNLGISEFTAGPIQAGSLLLSIPHKVASGLLYGGLLLLIFGNNPERRFYVRPLSGLWELYGFITGIIGDLLSYLRLFALGLSSGLLGGAFTYIAFLFVRDGQGDIMWTSPFIILSFLLLIFGHTLNFVLAVIGSIIHPLRLTFVEFLFNNIKYEGGGKAYSPFKLRKEITHGINHHS